VLADGDPELGGDAAILLTRSLDEP